MNRSRLLLAIVLVAVVAAAVMAVRLYQSKRASPADPATYQVLTPEQLARMLTAKDFVLINVHIPHSGDIDGTDLFIPYNELDRNLSRLPADKGSKIVLYCQSGHMSSIAAGELVRRGYRNVAHLDGGMTAWQTAGYDIVDRGILLSSTGR